MIIISIRPFLGIGVVLLAVFLILFSGKKPNVREFWTIAASIINAVVVFSMIPEVYAGNVYKYTLFL